MNFEELGLSDPILKAIHECGYTEPTPIQAQAIPHILMMRDVVGLAQTGTGKTAGFTLPMIEILSGGRAKARMPRSLILSPTRELAAQIAENFDTYGKYCKLSKALLTGGTSMDEQIKIMERGADVLIATPGRLLDLFERGRILMTDIKILVIDEADRMLDMGFIPDIEKIVSLLPPMRQTLLFSATMAPEIKRLTTKFLSNPREVAVSPPASTAVTVEQFLVHTSPRSKKTVLEQIIKQENVQNAFIFCNRKRDVDMLGQHLSQIGLNARPLHGDMAQSARTETLEKFKSGAIALLVCSDVAARGIDVSGTSHVFNYDVPINPDDYVHRIGRTGRAGMKGRAWMLATSSEEKQLLNVQKRIAKDITVVEIQAGASSSSGEGSDSKAPRKPTAHREKPQARKDNTPKESVPKQIQADRPSAKDKMPPKKNHSPAQRNEDSGAAVSGFGDDVPSFFR